MQKSRLVELIQTLDKKEVKEFRQFLASPFFNHREDVRQLYELILEHDGHLSKEAVAKELFRDSPYDPQQVRFVMSWLQKRLEKYLVVKTTLEDKVGAKTRLAQVFQERELPRHYQIAVREVSQKLQEHPLRNATFHHSEYLLAKENYLQASKKQRTGDLPLQRLTDQHDAYFLIEKLRQACLVRSHQAVFKKDYDLGLLPYLLTHLPKSFWQKWPAAEVYYQCFCMLDDEDGRPYFQQLKMLLQKNDTIFPLSELRDLYLFAINFSIRQFNGGDATFNREAFELYRKALAAELLTLDGYISRFAYPNIVALGLQLKEYDWVEHFITQYRDQLEAQHREATFSFNLAKLEYERQHYNEAIMLLQKADYKDVLLNLAAKTLLLKIYFQLDEYPLLDSHLAAMRRFVKRKKVIGYHQENYLNIVQTTQKLMELNHFDKTAVEAMHQQIEATDPLTEKSWLLEQLAGFRR